MKKNYLLSSLFGAMLMAMPVSADVIGMQTAVAVGEKITIALNQDVKATLTWGNGDSEDIVFNGEEVEFVVKDAKLTLTTDQKVTSIFCPDCSLTELDLDQVPFLSSLICPNNQLKSLNVAKNPHLKELNCEHNQLATLVLNTSRDMTSLNVGYNELTSLSLSKVPNLKTLICSNNHLKSLSITNLKEIETLWCQGNNLETISFSSMARPVQICAFDNKLSTLKVSNLEGTKDLWIDNNKFTELDLSNTPVVTLSASNNDLSLITLSKEEKDLLEAYYVDGNLLAFNSLPSVINQSTKDSLVAYNVENQRPYVYAEKLNMNEMYDMTSIIRRNAWGNNTRVKITWKDGDGKVLVKNEDIKISGDKFTFLKPFRSVSAEMTSFLYPTETFYMAPMQVVDPTGIEGVEADANLKITTRAGLLQVSVGEATLVRIYNVSGALVVEESVSAGTHSWSLPAGMYVVNGKKVVLSR